MENVVDFIYNNLFWIGMILLIPVFSRLFKIIFFHIFYRIKPIHKVTIRHIHDGELRDEIEIDLKSDEPYVRQLNRLKRSGKS